MIDTRHSPIIAVEEKRPLGDGLFQFHCHPGVSCYKQCCRQLDLFLYPYDIIRLKNCLAISSADFMHRYVRLAAGCHPYFPAVMLLMEENDQHTCPFLGEQGCEVYRDRPSACRTYPLERAVEKSGEKSGLTEHYFMTHHSYCKGHLEEKSFTVAQWKRDQQLYDYNIMNEFWALMDAFFATNPWQGEGSAGPRQQLAFMVCYNIDEFRVYCRENDLLTRSRLPKERKRQVLKDDAELLKFGFEWLQSVLK
jgi:Fe-S-cluster containining protein